MQWPPYNSGHTPSILYGGPVISPWSVFSTYFGTIFFHWDNDDGGVANPFETVALGDEPNPGTIAATGAHDMSSLADYFTNNFFAAGCAGQLAMLWDAENSRFIVVTTTRAPIGSLSAISYCTGDVDNPNDPVGGLAGLFGLTQVTGATLQQGTDTGNGSPQYLQYNWNYQFTPSVSTLHTSQQGPYLYYWSFGDGNTSTSDNPIHMYSNPSLGTVNIECSVTDTHSRVTGISSQQVIVADFSVAALITYPTESSNVTSGTVNFTSSSGSNWTGASLEYLWTFDDGSISTAQNPTKSITLLGSHSANLVVTDVISGYGSSNTVNFTVISPLSQAKLVGGVITDNWATFSLGKGQLRTIYNDSNSKPLDTNYLGSAYDLRNLDPYGYPRFYSFYDVVNYINQSISDLGGGASMSWDGTRFTLTTTDSGPIGSASSVGYCTGNLSSWFKLDAASGATIIPGVG